MNNYKTCPAEYRRDYLAEVKGLAFKVLFSGAVIGIFGFIFIVFN